MKAQMLMHVYRVTEWRDGAIFSTEWDHDEWQDLTHERPESTDPNFVFIAPSNEFALTMQTVRSCADDTPDPDTTNTRVSVL